LKRNKSSVFKPGERLEGTMLTVAGPGNGKSWRTVKCRCDCGVMVKVPYLRAYQYQEYSCGCTKRVRKNAVDYTGNYVFSERWGKKLTVLGRDSAGFWTYLCSCCAEIYTLPRGLERGVMPSLARIAGQRCPEYRVFKSIPRVYMEKYGPYMKPENIRRGKNWQDNGFMLKPDVDGVVHGWPIVTDYPMPKDPPQVKTKEEPVREDPDGFGDAFK
jgi:hypothetical protein